MLIINTMFFNIVFIININYYHLNHVSIYLFMTTNNVKSIYIGASLPAPTIFMDLPFLWYYLFMVLSCLWYYLFMELSFYGIIFLWNYLFMEEPFYGRTILWFILFMIYSFYGLFFLWFILFMVYSFYDINYFYD